MNNYDKYKESSYLVYLDANNLYGYAMSKKLPIRNFKSLDQDDISKFNYELIKKYNENSDIGYIFEVDIEYPKHIIDNNDNGNNYNRPNEAADNANNDGDDNKTSKKLNNIVALREYFSSNFKKICILVNEVNNDGISDSDSG